MTDNDADGVGDGSDGNGDCVGICGDSGSDDNGDGDNDDGGNSDDDHDVKAVTMMGIGMVMAMVIQNDGD